MARRMLHLSQNILAEHYRSLVHQRRLGGTVGSFHITARQAQRTVLTVYKFKILQMPAN
jgi:hypothetical protein